MLGVRINNNRKKRKFKSGTTIYSHILLQLTLLMDRIHVVTNGGVLEL